MPKSRNGNDKTRWEHIGVRINIGKKKEYRDFLKSFTDAEGRPRFSKLSTWIKWLMDGYIDGTIIEARSKEDMVKSGIQIREIIKEELNGATITFKNMISTLSNQFNDYRDYNIEGNVLEQLEKNSLTSEELAKKLKISEPELLRSLNRLVETKMIKINQNSKYEVMY